MPHFNLDKKSIVIK